jgi:hypothetical protein
LSRSERRRFGRSGKKLCIGCRARKAKFRYRGAVRADRDHTLCFQCFRSQVDRDRARQLAGPVWFELPRVQR